MQVKAYGVMQDILTQSMTSRVREPGLRPPSLEQC